MKPRNHFRWILLLLAVVFPTSTIAAEKELIQQMRDGGAVLMIRHAQAPGIGDPDGFKVDDCSTQRNLDEQGREQARAIGEWLRARGSSKCEIIFQPMVSLPGDGASNEPGNRRADAGIEFFFRKA